MNGLLDFISTPAGQGLLAAVAGGMAGANRGTPWNNAGRAGLAGLMGYSNAQNMAMKQEENAFQKQYRQMQMSEMERKAAMEQRQIEMQQQYARAFADILPGLSGPASVPYQDRVPPSAVGSVGLPSAVAQGNDPAKYFADVAQIQDPTERLAAQEAGFRLFPQARPQQQNQKRADAAATLATLGMQGSLAGVKGADALVAGAKYYEPQKMEAGAFYRNPITGEREFIPQVDKGMTLGPDNQVSNLPGYASSLATQEGAKTSAQESAKAPYAEPVKLPGVGPGGADVIVPRVNLPGLSGAMTSRSTVSTEGEKDLNKMWMDKTLTPIQEAGRSAESIVSQVQTLRQIPLNTGWGTEAKAGAANVLAGLGIATKNAEMFAANEQKFQQVASERLWTVLNAAKGPQTEGDADRARKTFAKVSNTPEANKFIMDLAEATAKRDMNKAAYYNEAAQLAKEDGNYTRIDSEWRKIQRSVWDDPIMQKWKQ